MGLTPHSVYGYVSDEDIEAAITARLQKLNGNIDEVRAVLSDAVRALLDINRNIPVNNKHRHLISKELERFAVGDEEETTAASA